MDKITKLSQAIRIGAAAHPKCFGSIMKLSHHSTRGYSIKSTCALGAAWVALHPDQIPTSISTTAVEDELRKRFPLVADVDFNSIIAWNDRDGYSRNQIAEKLEKKGL